MRAAKRQLEIEEGLPWVTVRLRSRKGAQRWERFILDTGSSNTILSVDLAQILGYPESTKLGVTTFDTPDGPVLGYTVRIPSLNLAGREIRDYLVGCKLFQSRLHVPGILGLDFFEETDFLLSVRSRSIHLTW